MIIDFHTHTFPDKIAPKAIAQLAERARIEPTYNGTVQGLLENMEKHSIDKSIILNIATRPGQEETINNTALSVTADSKGKLVSFGSVHPDSPDCFDELRRIKEIGLKGIKLHPDYQGFDVEEERMEPLYDALEELGLPVVFHAGWDCLSPDHIHCRPIRSAETARRHPGLRIILAHLGGMKMWDDVYDYLAGIPNVYFDTSMAATCGIDKKLMIKILSKHPEENILFGTDSPWENPQMTKDLVDSLNLPGYFRDMIYYKNALKLLE